MNRAIAGTVAAVVLAGCASSGGLTPEERAYRERVEDMPVTFNVAQGDLPAAWERARVFIARFSGAPVRTSSENLIETEQPGQYATSIGYRVRQSVLGDSIRITIQPMRVPDYTASDAQLAGERLAVPANARILALYMKTGELIPRMVEQ